MREDTDFDPAGKAFTTALKKARKAPVSFCFMLDKTGKEPGLMFHRKKAGRVLFKNAKGLDEGFTKGTYGTATLEGKVLTLDLEKELAGVEKACKIWRKTARHPFIKAIVLRQGGELLGGAAAEPQVETQRMKMALSEALKGVRGRVSPADLHMLTLKASEALKTQDKEAVAKVLKLLQRVKTAPEQGPSYAALAPLAKEWAALRKDGINKTRMVTKLLLQDHPELVSQASTMKKLYKVFDRKLAATMVKLMKTREADAQKEQAAQVFETARIYLGLLAQDPLFQYVAQNPYVTLNPKSDLSPTLLKIAKMAKPRG